MVKFAESSQRSAAEANTALENLTEQIQGTSCFLRDYTRRNKLWSIIQEFVNRSWLKCYTLAIEKLAANKQELDEVKIKVGNLTTDLKGKEQKVECILKIYSPLQIKAKLTIRLSCCFKFSARTSEIVDIGKIPTSCSDLQKIGYKTNGLFSVMGNKSVETVYCNFHAKEKGTQFITFEFCAF